jgi:hypothetical protein
MTKELLNFLHAEAQCICAMFDAVDRSVPHSSIILKIDEGLFLQEVKMSKMAGEL